MHLDAESIHDLVGTIWDPIIRYGQHALVPS